MGEYGPNPEDANNSVLSGNWSDLTNPAAYIEGAKDALAALKELLSAVQK